MGIEGPPTEPPAEPPALKEEEAAAAAAAGGDHEKQNEKEARAKEAAAAVAAAAAAAAVAEEAQRQKPPRLGSDSSFEALRWLGCVQESLLGCEGAVAVGGRAVPNARGLLFGWRHMPGTCTRSLLVTRLRLSFLPMQRIYVGGLALSANQPQNVVLENLRYALNLTEMIVSCSVDPAWSHPNGVAVAEGPERCVLATCALADERHPQPTVGTSPLPRPPWPTSKLP